MHCCIKGAHVTPKISLEDNAYWNTDIDFLVTPVGLHGRPHRACQKAKIPIIAVEENKTIVLLIDEGQKLSQPFLEILRTFLNYETNEQKLLQLIILSQMELLPRIKKIRNFMDRVSLKYIINPLDENQTREMIEFRLQKAGYENLIADIYSAKCGTAGTSNVEGRMTKERRMSKAE